MDPLSDFRNKKRSLPTQNPKPFWQFSLGFPNHFVQGQSMDFLPLLEVPNDHLGVDVFFHRLSKDFSKKNTAKFKRKANPKKN